VITTAEPSQEDQLRTREVRYLAMMSIRVVCLLAGAILVTTRPPLLWLWLTLCAAGMTVIPWVAVVLANDRLPKQRHRWRRHRPDRAASPGLPAGGPSAQVTGGSSVPAAGGSSGPVAD
jgi:L-asparagine transporter-like permease